MPTRKIADLPRREGCRHPDHLPAAMVVRPPGVYEHVCPSCGQKLRFMVHDLHSLQKPPAVMHEWLQKPPATREREALPRVYAHY